MKKVIGAIIFGGLFGALIVLLGRDSEAVYYILRFYERERKSTAASLILGGIPEMMISLYSCELFRRSCFLEADDIKWLKSGKLVKITAADTGFYAVQIPG